MIYRSARALCSILLSLLVAAKLLQGVLPAWLAHERELGSGILLLCGIRLAFVLTDVARGAIGWRRAILPCVVLVAVVSIFSGATSPLFAKLAAGLAELGVLAIAAYVAAPGAKESAVPFEERLFERVQLFLPPSFASILVAEVTILRAAIGGLFRRAAVPLGFGYAENSLFRVLPLIVLFCSPVDIVLVHVIFHLRGPLWTAMLIGADIYALAWAYGTLVTMRARPHQLRDGHLFVYKGIYARAAIALDSIQSAIALPPSRARRAEVGADLSLRGTAKVEIRLARPAQVVKWFVPVPQPVFNVTISADDPGALCSALERHRRPDVARAG